MKYRHHISVERQSITAEAYERICLLNPAGRTARGFRLSIDSEHKEGGRLVEEFVAVCEQQGLTRRNTSTTHSYGHTADRIYESELEKAELIILSRQVMALASESGEHLGLTLQFQQPFVVSDAVRRLIEPQSFSGILFGTTALMPKEGLAVSHPGPFWELRSSILLPKMSNIQQFVHPGRTDAEPFRGDYSKIILIADPPFTKGEPHFSRSALMRLGNFDLGNTFEKYMEPAPALVASARLYRYCRSHGVIIRGVPIQIDSP